MLCSLTLAEIGHGIYRANTPEIRERRRAFLDELKAMVPIHSVTESTAEIIARIGGEQAAKGVTLALELSYLIGTHNVRDFNRIPGLNVWSDCKPARTRRLFAPSKSPRAAGLPPS